MSEDCFKIIPELLNVPKMPAFRFVINKNTLKIIGAWDTNGKYYSRKEFSHQVEQLAKEKENGQQQT